eukprot:s2289_g3.t1
MARRTRIADGYAAGHGSSGQTRADVLLCGLVGAPWCLAICPECADSNAKTWCFARFADMEGGDGSQWQSCAVANFAHFDPLHEQLIAGGRNFAVTLKPEEADLFYIPAFFSVLFWMGTLEALKCIAETFAMLRLQPFFRRHSGHDHVVLHGVEFDFYRNSEPAFQLPSYDPVAANWLIWTVACPAPCGEEPDSWSLRARFVLIPFASRLRHVVLQQLLAPRRFSVGYVGAISGQGTIFSEREAFFRQTCGSARWLQTEDGMWHPSRPWTRRHFVLEGNTTVVDAFLLSQERFEELCEDGTENAPFQQDLNFWWVEAAWRWRLIPEAESLEFLEIFPQAFSIPFYGFSDGTLGAKLEALYFEGAPGDLEVNRRLQPSFNSMLFQSIYAQSEVCIVLPGDTADGTKRLWDAMSWGCLPAFASTRSPGLWPALQAPLRTLRPDEVLETKAISWVDFSLFFHGVNTSAAALRVLHTLRRLPKGLLHRKRLALHAALPSLVISRRPTANASQPTAVELSVEEAAKRSAWIRGRRSTSTRAREKFLFALPSYEEELGSTAVELPSLPWLMAEESATDESHFRACDRSCGHVPSHRPWLGGCSSTWRRSVRRWPLSCGEARMRCSGSLSAEFALGFSAACSCWKASPSLD